MTSSALYTQYKRFTVSRIQYWKPKVFKNLQQMIINATGEMTIQQAITRLDANMLKPSGLAVTINSIYVDAGRVWGGHIYDIVQKQATKYSAPARKAMVYEFYRKHPNDLPERLGSLEKGIKRMEDVLQNKRMPIGQNSELLAEIVSYLRLHNLQMVSEISGTMKEWILEKLIEGQQQGLSIQQVADNMLKDDFPANRAITIARTETVKAANYGAMQGAKKTGFQLEKEWIASDDIRTRRIPRDDYSHEYMDGKTVPMDEPFKVPNREGGFDSIPQPCDPSGKPGDVINCRCTVGFNVVRGGDGLPVRV